MAHDQEIFNRERFDDYELIFSDCHDVCQWAANKDPYREKGVYDGFEYAGDNSAVDTREVGIAKDTYDALTRLNNSKCFAYNAKEFMVQEWGQDGSGYTERLIMEKTMVFQYNFKDEETTERTSDFIDKVQDVYDMCSVCGFETNCVTSHLFWNRHGGKITAVYGTPTNGSGNGLYICVSDRIGECNLQIQKYKNYPIAANMDDKMLELTFSKLGTNLPIYENKDDFEETGSYGKILGKFCVNHDTDP